MFTGGPEGLKRAPRTQRLHRSENSRTRKKPRVEVCIHEDNSDTDIGSGGLVDYDEELGSAHVHMQSARTISFSS
jgi:hypothetical protein